jgi:V/A-type H+-transporting ATPase subunit E
MSQDQHMQALLDKIRTEGVEKAAAEAHTITNQAEARAREIVAVAEQRAAAERTRAERDAKAFQQRATDAVHQAARDVVLSVEKSVAAHFRAILLAQTTLTLSDPARLASLVEAAVAAYLAGGEQALTVCLAEKAATTADALRAAFVRQAVSGVTLVLDENTGAGFRVHLDNGRVEHDFTAAAVTEALARHLRPQLASLLKTAN